MSGHGWCVGLVVLAGVLAGCSGGDEAPAAAEPAPTVTVTATATAPATGGDAGEAAKARACEDAVKIAEVGFDRVGEAFSAAAEMTRALSEQDPAAHAAAREKFGAQGDSVIEARNAFNLVADACLAD